MYNKLNVLHWHISDDESFPLELKSHPEITKAGSYSSNEIYSEADVKLIIERATSNGIRVIPEVDSPGHVRSWGLSKETKAITVNNCPGNEHYNSLLDPSLDQSYEVAKGIYSDIQDMFPDPWIHMGGDEVFTSCWDLRPHIKEFMKENKI